MKLGVTKTQDKKMIMKSSHCILILTTIFTQSCFGAWPSVDGQTKNTASSTTGTASSTTGTADSDHDRKYQQWVKTLPPAHQAWEQLLQAELGNFYLPIHKRQKVNGQANAWDFVTDDPALPRVLLIGDSVSRAYTQTVRKELKGKANVHRAPANCGPTATGLKKIDLWLGDRTWHLIHFNFGIHDRNTPIEEYVSRLDHIISRLKSTGAKLVWSNTTPLPNVPGKYTSDSIIERNSAAATLMQKHGIATVDLFHAITPHLGEMQRENDCHFNEAGNALLGKTVANYLERIISDETLSDAASYLKFAVGSDQPVVVNSALNPTQTDGLVKQERFTSLFDGETFTGWEHKGNWVIQDGAFYRKNDGGSLTYTKSLVPDDFELRFEWKVSRACNSGVYYRPAQYEYQILDNVHSPYGENARQSAGSLFFCMAPSKDATKPFGQWNSGRVKCKGTVIEHWVNGQRVLSFDYTDPKWVDQVQLLKIRGADLNARGGRLWLQDHGQDVWFRQLRWREIPEHEVLKADPDFRPMPVIGEALRKEQERVKRMIDAQQKK